jgi:hypothetical protein
MRSALVVISWWSNCLGLACLHNLVRYTEKRDIYVVQVGKSDGQKERFRDHLPPTVKELPYSPYLPAEHFRVIEAVARDLLPGCEGLWFFDHDIFLCEDLEPWLVNMDREFERSACCLCHPQFADTPSTLRPPSEQASLGIGPSITSPAFWLSPARLPEGVPSFEPVPCRELEASRRPDLFRAQADLRMPEKDTLVLVREFLAERDMADGFSLQSLPRHDHLGGLYMFAGEIPPKSLHDWMEGRVKGLSAFYEGCPREWVATEDPVLVARLKEFQEAVSSTGQRGNGYGEKQRQKSKA